MSFQVKNVEFCLFCISLIYISHKKRKKCQLEMLKNDDFPHGNDAWKYGKPSKKYSTFLCLHSKI